MSGAKPRTVDTVGHLSTAVRARPPATVPGKAELMGPIGTLGPTLTATLTDTTHHTHHPPMKAIKILAEPGPGSGAGLGSSVLTIILRYPLPEE